MLVLTHALRLVESADCEAPEFYHDERDALRAHQAEAELKKVRLLIALFVSDKNHRPCMDALRFASDQWLEQIKARIDKMACVGGVDVQVHSLKPCIDEATMTELIARCTSEGTSASTIPLDNLLCLL